MWINKNVVNGMKKLELEFGENQYKFTLNQSPIYNAAILHVTFLVMIALDHETCCGVHGRFVFMGAPYPYQYDMTTLLSTVLSLCLLLLP